MLLAVSGLQVPVIPLLDVVGNTGAVPPWHKLLTKVKVGVTRAVLVTVIVPNIVTGQPKLLL